MFIAEKPQLNSQNSVGVTYFVFDDSVLDHIVTFHSYRVQETIKGIRGYKHFTPNGVVELMLRRKNLDRNFISHQV